MGGGFPPRNNAVGNLGLLIPSIVMEVHQGTVTTIGAVIPETVTNNKCPTQIEFLLITA